MVLQKHFKLATLCAAFQLVIRFRHIIHFMLKQSYVRLFYTHSNLKKHYYVGNIQRFHAVVVHSTVISFHENIFPLILTEKYVLA